MNVKNIYTWYFRYCTCDFVIYNKVIKAINKKYNYLSIWVIKKSFMKQNFILTRKYIIGVLTEDVHLVDHNQIKKIFKSSSYHLNV